MATIENLDTANAAAPWSRWATSLASFLRPNNTTAYTALDVYGDSTGTADEKSIIFPGCDLTGAIIGATVTIAESDTITPRLLLFNAEPTGFLDGDAPALVAGDVPKLVGYIDFVEATKVTLATNLVAYDTKLTQPMPYTSAGSSLYGILQTVSGYTPIASTRITIQLRLDLSRTH